MVKEVQDILFSRRFQSVYESLGVFSYMYVGAGDQGVDKKRFIEETDLYKTGNDNVLTILTGNNIIMEKSGKLHLNRSLFFDMSIWDLLVICEPWLKGHTPGDRAFPLKKFASSENLSRTYTQIYP